MLLQADVIKAEMPYKFSDRLRKGIADQDRKNFVFILNKTAVKLKPRTKLINTLIAFL